jgi:hypothetical protein
MDAIRWVAHNDDTEFMDEPDFDRIIPSISIILVSDIYQRTVEESLMVLKTELGNIARRTS